MRKLHDDCTFQDYHIILTIIVIINVTIVIDIIIIVKAFVETSGGKLLGHTGGVP